MDNLKHLYLIISIFVLFTHYGCCLKQDGRSFQRFFSFFKQVLSKNSFPIATGPSQFMFRPFSNSSDFLFLQLRYKTVQKRTRFVYILKLCFLILQSCLVKKLIQSVNHNSQQPILANTVNCTYKYDIKFPLFFNSRCENSQLGAFHD